MIFLVLATLLVFVVAWFTGRQVGVSTSTVTRLYDVRDLLVAHPDFNDPPTLGASSRDPRPAAPPVAPANPTPATRAAVDPSLADLVRRIETTIDPTSWTAPGRAITALPGHLAVTQTADVHEKVGAFLAELRASRAITVMVEATFFTFDPDYVPRLPPHVRNALTGRIPGPVFLSDADVAAILRNDYAAGLLSRPRVTVFSGQRAYALVANQRAYVAGVRQSTGPDGKTTTYQPVVDTASSGVILDVWAAVTPDRKHVVMNLRPQLAELIAMESAQQHTADGQTHAVNRPVVILRNVQTTVTVPDRQHALLTVFDQSVSPSTRPTTQPARQVFLLVKPAIALDASARDAKVWPGQE